MQINFPGNIRIKRIRPRLEGLRSSPFVNIDGEPYARPSLNGRWRVEMDLMCAIEDEYLALSAFLMAMSAGNTTTLPMTTHWLPNDSNGRRLNGFAEAPEFTGNHEGWISEPFAGYTLRTPATRRDSFIDVNVPELSQLRPGHRITLGDRLHEVIGASHIAESDTAQRLSLMPNVRQNADAGSLVVVDQLKLHAQMESAGDLEVWQVPFGEVTAVFVEAF
ncbi:hypothetical protein [Paracoccus sp. SM22M-07]|uniref:hypothetical protein n=1 Tax=Paracoccus sp. SM22M-07 TaxID=1520813 RepID=UPI00090F688B|nr:hypothetical protein [Paracoccus sp. SM22M-07]OJH46170.1 hypothetical protein IE00_02885 [Paracoccus sp. SM22M-07]